MKIVDPTQHKKQKTVTPQTQDDKSLTRQYEQLRQERYTLMTTKKILQHQSQERYREIKQQMSTLKQQMNKQEKELVNTK